MCSVHRVLLNKLCLQQATVPGDIQIRSAQIDGHKFQTAWNHGERTTAVRVELYSWHDE